MVKKYIWLKTAGSLPARPGSRWTTASTDTPQHETRIQLARSHGRHPSRRAQSWPAGRRKSGSLNASRRGSHCGPWEARATLWPLCEAWTPSPPARTHPAPAPLERSLGVLGRPSSWPDPPCACPCASQPWNAPPALRRARPSFSGPPAQAAGTVPSHLSARRRPGALAGPALSPSAFSSCGAVCPPVPASVAPPAGARW